MIHLFLGTKAQVIKTAPVVWELERQGIPYRLIDTGQHAELTSRLRKELQVREPDFSLRNGSDLASIRSGLRWVVQWVVNGAVRPAWIRDRIFANQGGICLVHGDTASTWLGAWLAKRAGLKVAHLEAGLRSFHPLSPFPEELFRWRTSRVADLLLAPSPRAAQNLKRAGVAGRIVELGGNTGLEAARRGLKQPSQVTAPWPVFILCSIHRMETLLSRRRLNFLVQVLLKAAAHHPLLFLLHEPTRRALVRTGGMSRLKTSDRIQCRPLVSHAAFLHWARQAQFLITDGGSVQEESYYLNVPCLLLRDRTERPEGVDPPGNVVLARWRWERVESFLKSPQMHRHREPIPSTQPSRVVVEALGSFLNGR